MENIQQILLNSSKNKKSVNENSSLNVSLNGNMKLLPEDAISDMIDSYKVYLDERENSNKFRIIVDINPYCSNILFNPFTEIVKDEGSSSAFCLNYTTSAFKNKTIGKKTGFTWNQYEAIRDTQISNVSGGCEYHCGIDIFNNHILRSKTFKSVNYTSNSDAEIRELSSVYGTGYTNVLVNEAGASHKYNDNNFNTIDDYLRDRNGVIISEHFPALMGEYEDYRLETVILPLHLYQDDDVYSFKDAVAERLIDNEGWYGFKNRTTNANDYYNKVINNKQNGEFISMYPGKDLYSFTPKYNSFRKRLEYNWNYCITYPSHSVVKNGNKDFPFFYVDDNGKVSLKSYMIDEGTVDDDGVNVLTVYSICQHGLMVNDTVNIYKTYTTVESDTEVSHTDLFYSSAEVLHVIDKYTFQVAKVTANMSNKWIEVKNRYDNLYPVPSGVTNYDILYRGTYVSDGNYYPICESNRCNIDETAQNIHFRRVVNGVECDYYIRKFSRLPNFKFKDCEVNEYTLYGEENSTLIKRFSNPQKPYTKFENHTSKLGFSNTIYGDDVTEIAFTDDIDISFLRDNLGRPLSDVYLTIVKNNKGYKEWYGIEKKIDIKSENVEYSHCFGKVNSSFLLSDYYRESYIYTGKRNILLYDVRDLVGNPQKQYGLINEYGDGDEIVFDEDFEYFGDICCYSPVDCDEQIIQKAMHRFNTVQRELSTLSASAYTYFGDSGGTMYYNEIKDTEGNLLFSNSNNGDPYNKFSSSCSDNCLYHTTKEKFTGMTNFEEGYYYQPHYRLSLKNVSSDLKSSKGIEYEIIEITKEQPTNVNGKTLFSILTKHDNNFLKNEKAVIYKRSTNEFYYMIVDSLLSSKKFKCYLMDENNSYIEDLNNEITSIDNIDDYVIVKKDGTVPSYAKLIKDGSCRYYWRNIVSNGIEDNNNVYPFTNGAFYITKKINFFLRRQDPHKFNLSQGNTEFNYVPEGEYIEDYNNLDTEFKTNYEADEIESC